MRGSPSTSTQTNSTAQASSLPGQFMSQLLTTSKRSFTKPPESDVWTSSGHPNNFSSNFLQTPSLVNSWPVSWDCDLTTNQEMLCEGGLWEDVRETKESFVNIFSACSNSSTDIVLWHMMPILCLSLPPILSLYKRIKTLTKACECDRLFSIICCFDGP